MSNVTVELTAHWAGTMSCSGSATFGAGGSGKTIVLTTTTPVSAVVDKDEMTFNWSARLSATGVPASDLTLGDTGPFTLYTVFGPPVSTDGNASTVKRLEYALSKLGSSMEIHGNAEAVAPKLAQGIAQDLADKVGYGSDPPNPIWRYLDDSWQDKADCFEQATLFAAALGQLGITANGSRAYPTSDTRPGHCDSAQTYTTRPSVLRYVLNQRQPDAYLNAYQGCGAVQDLTGNTKYYPIWPFLDSQSSLLGVLREVSSDMDKKNLDHWKYRQYWSQPVAGNLFPRTVDQQLHPANPPGVIPAWQTPVPLP